MSLSLLVITALIAVFIQNKIYKRWGLTRVHYDRSFSQESCYEGEEVELRERIANDKLLPLPWLRLESLLSSGLQFGREGSLLVRSGERLQNHRSLFALWSHMVILRRHKVKCIRRGCYDLETVTMSCGDLFGLTLEVRTLALNRRLLVFPRPAPLGELPLPWRGWMGEYSVQRWVVEDPFLLRGLRDYRPGDPQRSIHWKASSRSEELVVREFGYSADRRIMVVLNVGVTDLMWSDVTDEPLVEWGIRSSLTIVESCLAMGMPVGYLCNAASVDHPGRTVRIEPESGIQQHQSIVTAMAKLQMKQEVNLYELLTRETELEGVPPDYVIISAYTSPELQEKVWELERRGSRIELLLLEHPNQEVYRDAAG